MLAEEHSQDMLNILSLKKNQIVEAVWMLSKCLTESLSRKTKFCGRSFALKMCDKQKDEYFQEMFEAQQKGWSQDMFDRQPDCGGRGGAFKTCITVNVFYSFYTDTISMMYLHKKLILILCYKTPTLFCDEIKDLTFE